jgi:imidazolonepropionase-like amidohydrolase
MGLKVGQVKEGYLADLLLVAGDPTQDVAILQDKADRHHEGWPVPQGACRGRRGVKQTA